MSYSFSLQAATRAEIVMKAIEEYDKVIQTQPIHKTEQKVVMEAVQDLVAHMPEVPGMKIAGSVSGSAWKEDDEIDPNGRLRGIGMSINLSLMPE